MVSLKDALIGWSASDYDASIQLWRIKINTGYTLPSPTWRASPTWRKQKAFPLPGTAALWVFWKSREFPAFFRGRGQSYARRHGTWNSLPDGWVPTTNTYRCSPSLPPCKNDNTKVVLFWPPFGHQNTTKWCITKKRSCIFKWVYQIFYGIIFNRKFGRDFTDSHWTIRPCIATVALSRSGTTLKFWSATMFEAAVRNFGPVHKFELPTVIADSVPRATRVFSLASVGHVTGHMVSHMVPMARCRPPYWKIFTVNNLATVF